MNKYFRFLLIILVSAFGGKNAFGQKVDTVNIGTVMGLLRDSVHNYVMPSATISIYRAQGNELVSYQLSNNFGRFQFKKIPVGIPLRAVANRIGYAPSIKEFTILRKAKEIDLGALTMTRLDISLKEVTIQALPPPMQMRGDTLEFNAAAFKLDTNAVLEDMLHSLPTVTVWNDGLITVNGKDVKTLLVDGKPFFGGSAKIALQNIPKNAVQKIQVYERRTPGEQNNEPQTEMNVVLKKDKKDGFFGKLGYGAGTDKHYSGDGSISYFSPKTQMSLVGATNNINKSAGSAGTLIANNSYKGEGINNTYYADLSKQGLNVFKALGFTVQYNPDKKTTFNGDYLLNDGSQQVDRKSQTAISSATNGNLLQTQNSINKNSNNSRQAYGVYKQEFKHSNIDAHFNHGENNSSGISTFEQTSVNDLTKAASRSFSQNNYDDKQTTNSGEVKLGLERYQDEKGRLKSISFDLDYKFEQNRAGNARKTITEFTSTDTAQNKYFNRRYSTNDQNTLHTIATNFYNLSDYLRLQRYFTTSFENVVSFYHDDQHVNVDDLIAGGSQYTTNAFLTNVTQYRYADERPGIRFNKGFINALKNRYQKQLTISLFAQELFYTQHNVSQKYFQNLDRSYAYFTPSANVKYSYTEAGEYNATYTLAYNPSVNFPSIWQMAPLNDDANVYDFTIGNSALRPAYNHDVSLNYTYYTFNNEKQSLNLTAKLSAGVSRDFITDSLHYNQSGYATHHYVNVSGYQYANFIGSFRTSYKLKDHQFQLTGMANVNYSRYPSIVNGQHYFSKISTIELKPDFVYSYKGKLDVQLGEWYGARTTDEGAVGRFNYHNWQTGLGAAYTLPKGFFVDTRFNYNTSNASAVNNYHYAIWNADVGYRFLKGANAEVKFSALDMLHQNKSIFNYVGTNSITAGTVNVLQQFFMCTVAYYPRKFGLHKK